MFNINGWEMIVLVVVFLLVFGPDRLPQAAVQAGKMLRELRRAADEATGDLSRELEAAAREIREAESGLKGAGSVAQKALIDAALAPSTSPDKAAAPDEPSADLTEPSMTDKPPSDQAEQSTTDEPTVPPTEV